MVTCIFKPTHLELFRLCLLDFMALAQIHQLTALVLPSSKYCAQVLEWC